MEDQEILKRIDEQGKKIDAIYLSVERTRKYFLWTLIVTVALVVFPLIGLFLVIPQFLSTYSQGF